MIACKSDLKQISKAEIDDVIKTYDTELFLTFKNTVIHERSRDRTNIIYFVGRYEGKWPLYFVTYNTISNNVTEIGQQELAGGEKPNYFSKQQIQYLVNEFRKYKLCLLAVDNDGNILLNPFYLNQPASFLKKASGSNIDLSKLNGDFVQYSKDWYLDRSQLSMRDLK